VLTIAELGTEKVCPKCGGNALYHDTYIDREDLMCMCGCVILAEEPDSRNPLVYYGGRINFKESKHPGIMRRNK